MTNRLKTGCLAMAATLTFCVTGYVQAETLKVTGGAVITENFLEPIRDAFAKSSGITLDFSNSTPAQGWQQLTAGQVDAAIYGLSFNEVIASVEKQGGENG